ncbi:MAG: AraC family transcriptional regulator [Planctomycetes bacterium]|nr:AraC family transcriptional regulator [Planctomycetota bacterium]
MSRPVEELAKAVGRNARVDGSHATAIPRLTLYRTSTPTEHNAVVYVPSLCVVVQGAKEVVVGAEAYHYDPAKSVLVSVDLPATTRVVEASATRPCLAMRIELDAAEVGEFLADGTVPEPSGPPSRGIGNTRVEPRLLDTVTRLVALLDTPADVPALAPLVLREVSYRLLTGPDGACVRRIVAPSAPKHRIARAIHWLKEHYDEPARVDELAKRVGLSSSAFHLHFKAVTGLSPLQYQKRFRLLEARGLMLNEGLDAAEAAFRVGYESPSQFGREYRRLFGASPRRDVAALAETPSSLESPSP